jgi:hypothetical protein
MIKTSIVPQNNNVHLSVPNNYIGKEIEIILYAKEEVISNVQKGKKTFADFNGIISEEEYKSLKSNTEQAREQWNRDI